MIFVLFTVYFHIQSSMVLLLGINLVCLNSPEANYVKELHLHKADTQPYSMSSAVAMEISLPGSERTSWLS